MRELKFRAWWKHPKYLPEGKMFFVGGLMFAKKQDGEPEYDMPFLEVGLMDTELNSKIGWNSGDECTLMQYTGLKDKNGKEIYEGDVVKIQSLLGGGRISTDYIEWERTGFVSHFGGRIPRENRIEVIGNIYENPDLIKN